MVVIILKQQKHKLSVSSCTSAHEHTSKLTYTKVPEKQKLTAYSAAYPIYMCEHRSAVMQLIKIKDDQVQHLPSCSCRGVVVRMYVQSYGDLGGGGGQGRVLGFPGPQVQPEGPTDDFSPTDTGGLCPPSSGPRCRAAAAVASA
jgi:hypothetical protein